MVSVTHKWVYKNKFFVPLSKLILLILHTPKTTDIYIIVIYYRSKPTRIHDNNFLPQLIDYFLLFNVFKWGTFNFCKLTLWNNHGFYLNILLDGDV